MEWVLASFFWFLPFASYRAACACVRTVEALNRKAFTATVQMSYTHAVVLFVVPSSPEKAKRHSKRIVTLLRRKVCSHRCTSQAHVGFEIKCILRHIHTGKSWQTRKKGEYAHADTPLFLPKPKCTPPNHPVTIFTDPSSTLFCWYLTSSEAYSTTQGPSSRSDWVTPTSH